MHIKKHREQKYIRLVHMKIKPPPGFPLAEAYVIHRQLRSVSDICHSFSKKQSADP